MGLMQSGITGLIRNAFLSRGDGVWFRAFPRNPGDVRAEREARRVWRAVRAARVALLLTAAAVLGVLAILMAPKI